MANKGGFSWKRASGVTGAKQSVSRKTGVPMTQSGRQRKVGSAITDGGCIMVILPFVLFIIAVLSILF